MLLFEFILDVEWRFELDKDWLKHHKPLFEYLVHILRQWIYICNHKTLKNTDSTNYYRWWKYLFVSVSLQWLNFRKFKALIIIVFTLKFENNISHNPIEHSNSIFLRNSGILMLDSQKAKNDIGIRYSIQI